MHRSCVCDANSSTGVSAVSLDPYQIGFENERGIIQFRPRTGFYRETWIPFDRFLTSSGKLTEHEENKIMKSYEIPGPPLRRLCGTPRSGRDGFLKLDRNTRRRLGSFSRSEI